MIEKIISKYNDRDSLYANNLTNHLNMGLYALYKMGATEDKLNQYAKDYIKHSNLPELKPVLFDISISNFEEYLGVESSYSSFIIYFNEILNKDGKEIVLKTYINRLIDGEAGGAFHSIIRLAYAIELNSNDEIAKALAYLAEAYTKLPMNTSYPISDPIEAILKLSKDNHFREFTFKRKLILGHMIDIFEDPRFNNVLTDMCEENYNDNFIADLLLKLYLLTEDFTILHGFTSTHALRVLKPYINDYQAVLKRHWRLLQLAYLSTGCVKIGKLPEAGNNVPGWNSIFEKICNSIDVHSIKLVYSLSEQAKLFEDDKLFRIAAAGRS